MAKKPPPSESATHPAMVDSHLDLSSLISGTCCVNVDALTISPTAWTTSHSSMVQRPPDEVHKDTKSAKLHQPVPKCVGPTHDPTASAESSVNLSVLSSHHDIFSINSYVMNSYFNANISIYIFHCSPRSYEFISFVNDMNSYSLSMI